MVLGTSNMFTKSGPSDPVLITKMLQIYKTKYGNVLEQINFHLWESQKLKMDTSGSIGAFFRFSKVFGNTFSKNIGYEPHIDRKHENPKSWRRMSIKMENMYLQGNPQDPSTFRLPPQLRRMTHPSSLCFQCIFSQGNGRWKHLILARFT